MEAQTDPTNRSKRYEYDHARTTLTVLSIASVDEYSSLHDQRIFGPHTPESISPPERETVSRMIVRLKIVQPLLQ